MGFLYRPSQNDFLAGAPANEIHDSEYGYSLNGRILYPWVSSCTTVTLVLQDDSALGIHLGVHDPVQNVDATIAEVDVVRAGRGIRAMYLVGVLNATGMGWKNDARYVWPQQKATLNTAFGRNAGDLVQGYQQPVNNECDYRAIIGVGGAVLWMKRDTRHGANLINPWDNMVIGAV